MTDWHTVQQNFFITIYKTFHNENKYIWIYFLFQGLKGDLGPVGPVGPKGDKVSESAIYNGLDKITL